MIATRLVDIPIGEPLNQDILSPFGHVLLPRGTVFEVSYLEKLMNQGMEIVYFSRDPHHKGQEKDAPAFRRLRESYGIGIETIREMGQRIQDGRVLDLTQATNVVNSFLKIAIDDNNVLNNLKRLKDKDEYTIEHSVSVALTAVIIGTYLNFNESQLVNLGLAGLMHDLGKYQIPDEILKKPGSLSNQEYREIAKHPVYGYHIVSKIRRIPDTVSLAILQHHERADGQGYPLKINKQKTHEFARILAIADMFDALTSNRVYRPRTSAYTAAEIILEGCFGQIDPSFGLQFLDYLASHLAGRIVRLNNGEIGEVVLFYPDEPARPMVRIGKEFIDLRKHHDILISEVIR